jgi:hypothetical protein
MVIGFPRLGRPGRDGMDAAGNALLQDLRAYWEALRDGGLPPKRALIDPRAIEGLLGGAFILERVAPGVARFRIAGSHLAQLAGCDPRGMPFSALFDPAGRESLAGGLEQVFSGPAHLDLLLEAERGVARPALAARCLIFPLRNEAGQTDLAIGGLVFSGDAGRRARRFHVARTKISLLERVAGHVDRAPVAATGFAEPAAGFVPATAASRGHLRLVHSQD